MKGITFNEKTGRWRARTTVGGVRRRLGSFETKEEAEFAIDLERKIFISNSFDEIPNELEPTPVTRRWRSWKPTFITRVFNMVREFSRDLKAAWNDTKY